IRHLVDVRVAHASRVYASPARTFGVSPKQPLKSANPRRLRQRPGRARSPEKIRVDPRNPRFSWKSGILHDSADGRPARLLDRLEACRPRQPGRLSSTNKKCRMSTWGCHPAFRRCAAANTELCVTVVFFKLWFLSIPESSPATSNAATASGKLRTIAFSHFNRNHSALEVAGRPT